MSSYVTNPLASFAQNQEEEIHEVINNLTLLAQHWGRLLCTTGGALNLSKSFWYLMSWS